MPLVHLEQCGSYDKQEVREHVRNAFQAIGGLHQWVRPGSRVLVKPNILCGQEPQYAATTHPAVVGAVLAMVRELGGIPSVGDDPAFGTLEQVCRGNGLAQAVAEYDAPLVPFNRPVKAPSACPAVCSHFIVDQAVIEADAIINVPKLKAHRQLLFTAGVKNLYGCMPGKRKAMWHMRRGNTDPQFAFFLAAFGATVAPAITLVDAIIAMERDGPKGGDPRQVGLLAAGADPFAIDSVLAYLLRVPQADNLIVNAASRLKLGETDLSRIQVSGLALEEASLPDWKHPLLIGVRFSPGRLVRSTWRNWLITHGKLAA